MSESRNPEGIATLMSEDGLNALLLKPLDAWTAAETMLVWNMALRWVVHYTRSESSVDTRELVRSLRNIADEQDAEGDAFATRAGSVLLREAADALVASETAKPDSERINFLAEITNLSALESFGRTPTAEEVRLLDKTTTALSSGYEVHRRTQDTPAAFRAAVDDARRERGPV